MTKSRIYPHHLAVSLSGEVRERTARGYTKRSGNPVGFVRKTADGNWEAFTADRVQLSSLGSRLFANRYGALDALVAHLNAQED